ncbi:MAG: hypothetical protein A2X40_01920 [Elusimicrobia bacterium GWC2_65_9]|nr:MAG: hypothetical protein A2X40_01920 [Elusimicrobia bacterium GWC2_65_9]
MARKPPTPPLWTLVVLVLFLLGAYHVHEVLIPFALSFAFAFLLNPVVHYFEVRGLKRTHLVICLYSLVAMVITLAAQSFLPEASRQLALLQGKAPMYFVRVQEIALRLQQEAAQTLPFGQSLVNSVGLNLYEPVMAQLPKLPTYVLGLFPLFSLLFLVPFITFFMLLDSTSLLQRTVQTCPSRHVEQALHLLSEVDTSLGNYIRGVLIIVLVIGVASFVGLKTLGVDYALAVAVLAGISSFIPYLGAIMGAAVGALVAFFQFHNVSAPLQVVVLFAGIRMADEAFVQPLVSKHSIHLHPLVFLLALMLGGKLFGFIGLLFAVPAACILKALLVVGWDWYVSEAQMRLDSVDGSEVPYT